MAYIPLKNEQLPGIVGLFDFRPETAVPMRQLAEILLKGPSSLSSGEREIIAASVSYQNDCHFCHTSHAAAAASHLEKGLGFIDEIKAGFPESDAITPKLRALLQVAHKVQKGGKFVQPEDIDAARQAGATDLELHDTVLIAAAFCMYNRYVDGLNTWAPESKEDYLQIGSKMANIGYIVPFEPPPSVSD